MPKTISKALEQRLLRSKPFYQTLQDLHSMTGLEVIYVGALGEEKLRVPRGPATPLRRLDHLVPLLAAARQEVRQATLVDQNPAMEFPWKEVIHPLRIEQEPIGYVVLSAWRPDDESTESLEALWTSWVKSGQQISWPDLKSTWQSLPMASAPQLEAWKRHLRLVTDDTIRNLEHPNDPHLIPEHLPPLIRQACEEVQSHFRDSVTLTEVARNCGVSPEHLSRSFHQNTGLRFRDYVTETRIQEICRELVASSDAIGTIAERNGFATLSRFNRAFRDTTGMTPREWRKRQFRKQR